MLRQGFQYRNCEDNEHGYTEVCYSDTEQFHFDPIFSSFPPLQQNSCICRGPGLSVHMKARFFYPEDTVPLKSKLTLETRTSILKAFSNMHELERVSRKQFISRRKNNTVIAHAYSKVQVFRVDRYRVKTFDQAD